MKIENSFTLDAPIEQVWPLLTDIPTVASCVPGVGLTHEDEGEHFGSVKSKVGPVTAEYRSSATLIECDESMRRVVLKATGHDSRGAGNVEMLVTAKMTGAGDQTRIDLSTQISGTGKVAQLSRGVLKAASEKLLAQFVSCMSVKVQQDDVGAPSVAGTPVAAGPADETTPEHDALDLLGAAGGAVAKRLVPVAIVLLIVVVALLIVL